MNKIVTISRANGARLAASALALMAAGAQAQATAGATAAAAIAGAQAEALIVVGALTVMGIAVWAAIYIKRKFFP